MGHTVLGKTVTVNYKGKKRRKAEDEELMIFKNTHEAIIDEETWELAHRLRKTIRKPSYPDRPANPLTGLVYCADCGHKLTHRQPSPNKEKIFDADNAYVCSSYRQLTRDCSMHFIKTSALQDLILSAIREISTFVRSDEKEFLHLVRDETNAGIEIAAKEQKKQLHKAEKRIAELDGLIKKLYEGNAIGKIPDKHFNRMLTEYDKEQSSLEQEFSALQQAISTQKQDYENPQRFIALVKRHTDFAELTTPMLNEFIEKVIVHEATGDRAHRKLTEMDDTVVSKIQKITSKMCQMFSDMPIGIDYFIFMVQVDMNGFLVPEEVRYSVDIPNPIESLAHIIVQGQIEGSVVSGDALQLSIIYWAAFQGLCCYAITGMPLSLDPKMLSRILLKSS